MIGLDYGIKPKFMVLGNMEFQEILARSLEALGYSQLEHFGVITEPPLLVMIFSDDNDAAKCFEIFNTWVEESSNGDAVGIGFIKFTNNEYGLCIYPEPSKLIERVISEELRDEIDPLVMTIGYLKIFPQQSKQFLWFEKSKSSKPCVVAPGTVDQKIILDKAFRKLHINFYLENDVPKNSIEGTLLRARNAGGEGEISRPFPRINQAEISQRRLNQLDRFFPVTQERLKNDRNFQAARLILLQEGFAEWQIIQAACNIAFGVRNPELFVYNDLSQDEDCSGEEMRTAKDPIEILEHLVYNFEEPSVQLPPYQSLSAKQLQEQIILDSKYLLNCFTEESEELDRMYLSDLQDELRSLELL